jgi:hypothetical protein
MSLTNPAISTTATTSTSRPDSTSPDKEGEPTNKQSQISHYYHFEDNDCFIAATTESGQRDRQYSCFSTTSEDLNHDTDPTEK